MQKATRKKKSIAQVMDVGNRFFMISLYAYDQEKFHEVEISKEKQKFA